MKRFTTWTQKVNPKDLEDVPTGVPRKKESCEEQNAAAIDNEWQPRRWDAVLMQNKDRHKGRRRKMRSLK